MFSPSFSPFLNATQFYYPKYGPGQMYEEMARKFVAMGGKILKNYNVVKINNVSNKIIKHRLFVGGLI